MVAVKCERLAPSPKSKDVPAGRSGHRIVCIDDEIFVIGGYVQLPTGLEVFGEIWAYNILAQRWRRLNLKNSPFHLALSACALVIDKRIFIHGGTGIPFAQDINNTIIEIDVVNGECKEHPCLPKDGEESNIPEATYGHTLTHIRLSEHESQIDGGMLIKVGGARGAPYSNIISAFYFATHSWERLFGGSNGESFETFAPRYRHDAVFWRDELYIIGGTNLNGSLPFWPMPVFNVKQRNFRYINFSGQCPSPIRYPCSVHFDNLIFTTGGVAGSHDILNANIYAFNLEKLTFQIVGSQDLPTFFHDLAVIPWRNEFYSFGGVRDEKRVNHLHRFQVLGVTPPCLKELCWLRLTDLLRTFYPPELNSNYLWYFIRTAAEPLLGLSNASSSSSYKRSEVGDDAASNMAVTSVQGVLAFTKSILSYLLGKSPYAEKTAKLSTMQVMSSQADVAFDCMMSATKAIINSIEVERKVDAVESVTIFLVVLFYCNGAPLKYLERLPYGVVSLKVVSRYMEKVFADASSEDEDSDEISARPHKRMLFAPA
nr:kelch domain containing protein 10 [Hymenolepis microstoma]